LTCTDSTSTDITSLGGIDPHDARGDRLYDRLHSHCGASSFLPEVQVPMPEAFSSLEPVG